MAFTQRGIYGSTLACECGRTHRIEPQQVVYADDAIEQLPSIAGRWASGRRAAVVMDARTRQAAGAQAAAVLHGAGWAVQELLVQDPGPNTSPVCDDRTHEKLSGQLREADLILSVGSGVVCDLGKWLSFDRDLPFLAFATAASMNGYASANVAPTIEGVKALLRARPPVAVLSSRRVLRSAPPEMTAAGLGDVLAKSVSSADWKLNQLLFGDYYCPRAVGLIAEIEPLYLDRPEALREQDQAIDALFEALLLTGVAMTMAETSSPSSGGEHLISHSLDMMSSVDGRPHDLHGRQVGVGTILAAEIYRRVLAADRPQWREPTVRIDRPFWGRLADEVATAYQQKIPRLQAAAAALSDGETWDAIRRELPPLLRRPESIRDCLRRAGAAHLAEDIACDRARLLGALLHAHEIRDRFTILDVALLAGVMPWAAGEIVESLA